jgi:type I restriction enzyme S subunit
MVPLGEILTPSEEWIDLRPEETYQEVTVRLWGKGVALRRQATGAEIAAKTRLVVHTNQFILSRIDARNGAFGLIPQSLDGAIVSNDFPVFATSPSHLLPEFLSWTSKTSGFVQICKSASEGTTNRVRLKVDRFLATRIPLPPLDEQRRIVARTEQLAAKIQEARDRRTLAVQGVEALWPSTLTKAYDEAAGLAGQTTRLDDLCLTITDGTHVTPRYVSEGVPFLSVKDITSGKIRFDDARLITREEHAVLTKRCRPERGDVLLTKVGTTGFAKAIDVDREFSIFVSLALLKLDKKRLNPKFTEYMLNSSRLKECSSAGTRGVGNQNLVLKFIREFPMPAPELFEQHRIVAHLDSLQATVEALKRLQAETAAELDALLPSILDKAFRGDL